MTPSKFQDQDEGRTARAWLALLVALFLFCALRPLWDIDLFWHIVAGREIRTRGALPLRDTFSGISPERPWIPFQWAYEVLVSFLDDRVGLEGLRIIHILLHTVGIAWAAILARRRNGRAAALVVAILMVAYLDRMRARPHVFNLLGALALVQLLGGLTRRIAKDQSYLEGMRGLLRLDLPLTLLALLWGNLHAGGSLVLPMVAGAWALGLAIEDHLAAGAALRAVGLAALALVLSPGFMPGVVQAFSMYGESKGLIPEWQPTWVYLLAPRHPIHPIMGLIPLIMLGLVLRAGLRSSRRQAFLPALVLAALGLMTARFLYLAALVPLLWPAVLPRRAPRLALAAALVLALLFLHEHLWVQRAGPGDFVALMGRTLEPRRFPEEASDFIDEAGLEGTAVHQSDWGGWLLYRHYPRIRPFADGRGNFGAEVVNYLRRAHDPRQRHAWLLKERPHYGGDLVVFPPRTFPLDLHDRESFLLVHADPVAEVYLMAGPRFAANRAAAKAYYTRLGKRVPDPGEKPALFEQQVRAIRARRTLAREPLRRALADLAARSKAGGSKGRAARLEMAAIFEEQGDLLTAAMILRQLAADPEVGPRLRAACHLRTAALLARMGRSPQEIMPLLRGLDPRGLAPADRRLYAELARALAPASRRTP